MKAFKGVSWIFTRMCASSDLNVMDFLKQLNRKETAEFMRVLGQYKVMQLLAFFENNDG